MKNRFKDKYPVLILLLCIVIFALISGPDIRGGQSGRIFKNFTCPSKLLFSFDCPLCGTTRSFASAAYLNISDSLNSSVPGFILFIYISLQIILHLFYIASGSLFIHKIILYNALPFFFIIFLFNWLIKILIKLTEVFKWI